MFKYFWNKDKERFRKISHFFNIQWNKYLKNRLGPTRASMHLVPFYTKESLLSNPEKSHYKWAIVTKEL